MTPELPIALMVSGGTVFLILAVVTLVTLICASFCPKTFKKYTKRCRKPIKELTAENGRGPVADQLRAILADQCEKTDIWKKWDKDGGGSVSRKEFRNWWPMIGYIAPADEINDLFDEFDVDGSGEIDQDEFRTAFEQRGQMWKELAEKQGENDEIEILNREIAELRAFLGRKEKILAVEEASVARITEGIANRQLHISKFDDEIAAASALLAEKEARIAKFKSGIKETLKAAKVVSIFQANLTPEQAAVHIQARIRGANQRKADAQKALSRGSTPKWGMKRPSSRATQEGVGRLENEVEVMKRQLAEQERELLSMQSSFAAYQNRLKGMAAQPMQMLGFSGGYQYPQVLPSNRKPAEDGLM